MASLPQTLTPSTLPPRPDSPIPAVPPCRAKISRCPTPTPIHQLPSGTDRTATLSPFLNQLYPIVDNEEPENSDCESDCGDEETGIPIFRSKYAGGGCAGLSHPPRDVEEAGASIDFHSNIINSSCVTLTGTPRLETKGFKLPTLPCPEADPFVSHGLDKSPLPPKKGPRFYRYIRWNFGSVYRRIFSLVYLANIITLVVLIARYAISADRFKFTYQQASIAVTTNILAVVTVRNEHVVNGMFWVFGTWSKNLPLGFRTLAAKVYSYGGIHSAGAVSATFWYITFLVLLTMEFQKAESLTVSRSYIYLVSYVILLLLVSMLISAHPHLRRTMHNWFEGIHRCMGWLAILLFWAQAMLLAADATQTSGTSFGKALLVSPNFWMLIPITLLIAYPWTRLRLRPVEAEVLSQHCVKLNFTYRNVHFGQAVRLTDAPLRETHAFGVIPFPAAPAPIKHDHSSTDYTHTEKDSLPSKDNNNNNGDFSHDSNPSLAALKHHALASPTTAGQLTHAGERGFSVIISNAGDWTKKIIACPPAHIYTRGAPQFGVMRCAGLFSPCVVVATGSGIAPCLSLFVQRPDHPVRIIWSTKDPVKTYGRQVVELVYKTDPEAVVIDTSLGGKGAPRPDLVKLAYRVWEQGREVGGVRMKGEAVVIISNQKVTKKVVYGLETRGVPAYGAIFDS